MATRPGEKNIKKFVILRMLALLLFGALALRFFCVMVVDHDLYEQKAVAQQTSDVTIEAKRGTITDRDGNILAMSATAYKVVMSPTVLTSDEKKEALAVGLAEILDLDTDDVRKMTQKKSQYVEVKRRIEKSDADAVNEFLLTDKAFAGAVTVAEDTKRYYPNGNLLSTVLGFVGNDSQGLAGIEYYYDSYLKGSNGKLISVKTAKGTSMPFEYEKVVDAMDGATVVLTTSLEMQAMLEKYIENARVEYNVQERVAAIIMDVNTGAVLAMTSKPDYDPNDPFTINDEILLAQLAQYTDREEYVANYNAALQTLRKNKALENYEPGSTFKIFTSCMVLEEGLVDLNETFVCTGGLNINGTIVHCAKTKGHGTETFKEALANSCNPVFMILGARVGQYKMYDYITIFGLRNKTNVGLPGEESGVHYAYGQMSELNLANVSFGQSFKITPIQLITGVCSVANGGNLMQPYIVKEIIDANNNILVSNTPTVVRKTISKETSEIMREYLEFTVVKGKTGYLKGYRIAGKTGTSQKLDSASGGKKIASYVCFAPVDDPQIAVVVQVDEPIADVLYGSYIAAPLGKEIMGEALEMLGIEPDYGNGETLKTVTVPKVTGKEIEVASSTIGKNDLTVKIVGAGDTVLYQLPKNGTSVSEMSTVLLFTEEGYNDNLSTTVPNLIGKTAAECNMLLTDSDLNIKVVGSNLSYANMVAVSQSVEAGTEVKKMTVVTVEFAQK